MQGHYASAHRSSSQLSQLASISELPTSPGFLEHSSEQLQSPLCSLLCPGRDDITSRFGEEPQSCAMMTPDWLDQPHLLT